jgi:hypothetical protein
MRRKKGSSLLLILLLMVAFSSLILLSAKDSLDRSRSLNMSAAADDAERVAMAGISEAELNPTPGTSEKRGYTGNDCASLAAAGSGVGGKCPYYQFQVINTYALGDQNTAPATFSNAYFKQSAYNEDPYLSDNPLVLSVSADTSLTIIKTCATENDIDSFIYTNYEDPDGGSQVLYCGTTGGISIPVVPGSPLEVYASAPLKDGDTVTISSTAAVTLTTNVTTIQAAGYAGGVVKAYQKLFRDEGSGMKPFSLTEISNPF